MKNLRDLLRLLPMTVTGFLVVPSVWMLSWLLTLWLFEALYYRGHLPDLAARGQFGAIFGAVTSLFNALAFSGILATLWAQGRRHSQQLSDEAAGRRSQRTLELFHYWNSSDMLEQREIVNRFIYETAPTAKIYISALAYGDDPKKERYRAVVRIAAFCEECLAMISTENADAALMDKLLEHEFQAWNKHLFSRIADDESLPTVQRVRAAINSRSYPAT
jgi:hypothetical protein